MLTFVIVLLSILYTLYVFDTFPRWSKRLLVLTVSISFMYLSNYNLVQVRECGEIIHIIDYVITLIAMLLQAVYVIVCHERGNKYG